MHHSATEAAGSCGLFLCRDNVSSISGVDVLRGGIRTIAVRLSVEICKRYADIVIQPHSRLRVPFLSNIIDVVRYSATLMQM